MKADRLEHGGDVGEEPGKRRFAVPGVQPELRAHHHLLVFEEQRNLTEPCRPSAQQLDRQGVVGAAPGPQRRDDDVGFD